MVFRNPHFLRALALTVFQQLLLALSTFYIAQAGAALAQENIDRILPLVSLFFIYALAAYITSSMAAFLTARAANQIWQDYSNQLLSASTTSLQYASNGNKKSMAQWLGGEAQSTIAHACEFHLDMASVCLNIVFTLAVFHLTVGWEIASAIAASLGVSFAFAMALRRRIDITAGEMQQRRLETVLSIEPAWWPLYWAAVQEPIAIRQARAARSKSQDGFAVRALDPAVNDRICRALDQVHRHAQTI